MQEPNMTYDAGAIRFNQASIIALVLAGFILNSPVLPAVVAAIMLAGSRIPALALFRIIYFRIVRPMGLMRPLPRHDDPAPHDFAQLLGGTVLAGATLLLLLGSEGLGWSLAWLVVLLAVVNVAFGFCAGCFVYFQLGRFGVPGFGSQAGGGRKHA